MRILLDWDGHGGYLPLGDPLFRPERVAALVEREWWPADLDVVTGLELPFTKRVVLTSNRLFNPDGQQIGGFSPIGGITDLLAPPPVVAQLEAPAAMKDAAYAQTISHELGHAAGLRHEDRSAPMRYESPDWFPQWTATDLRTVQAEGVPLIPDVQQVLDQHPGREIVFTWIT